MNRHEQIALDKTVRAGVRFHGPVSVRNRYDECRYWRCTHGHSYGRL